MPFNLDWKDQWVLKVGAQVDVTKELKLRAGYNYGKLPLDKDRAFENLAFPAIAEHHVTAGVGYALSERLGANLAVMYSPKAMLGGSNPSQGLASYETTMSQYSIDAGLAWRF